MALLFQLFWEAFFDAAFKYMPQLLEALPKIIGVWQAAMTPTVKDAPNVPQQVADELQKRIADSQH